MRTKNLVLSQLDKTSIVVNKMKVGMDTNSVTPADLYKLILEMEQHMSFITEKIELEPDAY